MSDTFSPSGCITLTTDFGAGSPFVGVMKAVILNRLPSARIIDLFHGVAPYDADEAGFWLGRSYAWSAPGTVHVAVVDPGVGSSRRIIAAYLDGHVFLAPDNGLLDQAFASRSGVEYRVLDVPVLPGIELPTVSATFHGRDIFAPVAAGLAAGVYNFAALGPPVADITGARTVAPRYSAGRVEGVVISVDHYGNLISNIDREWLSEMSSPRVECAGMSCPLVTTYSDGSPGEPVALINSFGVVEVACSGGHAAGRLGVGRGARITVYSFGDAL